MNIVPLNKIPLNDSLNIYNLFIFQTCPVVVALVSREVTDPSSPSGCAHAIYNCPRAGASFVRIFYYCFKMKTTLVAVDAPNDAFYYTLRGC